MRPHFPHVIDSTIISNFRSCPRKAQLSYFEHWKPKSKSTDLHAGGAFAKGLEAGRKAFFEQGFSARDAEAIALKALVEFYGDFIPAESNPKTLDRMCGALEFYFSEYPFGIDSAIPITTPTGRRGIEFSFLEPIEIMHPETGDPICIAGRADMIADFAGSVFIFDEKTTKQLGPSWSKKWEMRSQFTCYCWAALRSGMQVAGTIVRGVSILKTKYETQQAITYRAPWEIDRWYEQVLRDINNMICCWQEGYWDYNLDESCNDYGNCTFYQVCKSANPDSYLAADFERRVWDPTIHKELSYEDYLANF